MENLSSNVPATSFKLTIADIRCFAMIIRLRCLSITQAWTYFYKPRGLSNEDFRNNHLKKLSEQHYVNIVNSAKLSAIFVTQKAIKVIENQYNISKFVVDDQKSKLIQHLPTETQLNMNPRLIPHQVYLNQFVLNFRIMANQKNILNRFTYLNEKQTSAYKHIRPDGVYRFDNKVDFILEMDMGTESPRQLTDKWARYRLNVCSQQYHEANRKMIVLFILNGDKRQQLERKKVVLKTISDTFVDLFEHNFEIYVGSIMELTGAVFKKILPEFIGEKSPITPIMNTFFEKKFKYTITAGESLHAKLDGIGYGYYMRQLSIINGKQKIRRVNGVSQEFLFDEYFYCPVSVLGRIELIQRTSILFQMKYNRKINYVVLIQDTAETFSHLKVSKLTKKNNIYFTTIDRLKKANLFHEAIFKFDDNGNILVPVDETWENLKLEQHYLELYNKTT